MAVSYNNQCVGIYCIIINAVGLKYVPLFSHLISVSEFKLAPPAAPCILVMPPSQRLWVATLALTLAVVEIPGVVQKCIYDEVQTLTRVVRAAPMQPSDPLLTSEASVQTGQGEKSGDRRATLQPGERLVKTPASAQPIRIHGWRTAESSNLLQPERERLQAAVQEAFSVVSSLLSGGAYVHKHMHKNMHERLLTIKFQQ